MEKKRQKLSIPRPWGHEQYLSKLVGKSIWVNTTDEATYKGNLKSFDRYTILLEDETGHPSLIFKSAIESVCEVRD